VELLGIALSLPIAFAANLVYCLLLAKVVVWIEALRRILLMTSIVVLLAFVGEVSVLASIGPVRSSTTFGAGFYVAHIALFFAGPPALANVLVLRKSWPRVSWYWAVPFCTLFAFGLVLLQIAVSEALYGVDGLL